ESSRPTANHDVVRARLPRKETMVRRKVARARGTAVALVLVAVALAAAPTSASGQPGHSALPTFRLSNTGATGVEVNLGITSKGSIFFGGWDHIARSDNNGKSWQALTLTNVGPSNV